MSPPASVLVALAQPALRAAMVEILRGAGHRPVLPADGSSIPEACLRDPIDLVALEPGSDELAAVRDHRDLPYMPVLLVSLQDRDEERAAGLREGADDFVGIDVPEEELLARVEALAKLARLAGPIRGEIGGAAYLKERLAIEFERAGRLREPLSLLLADGGDGGVEALAAKIAKASRRSDPLARCKSGELAVVLRNTHFAGAAVAAQRMLAALKEEPRLTIGVGCHPSEEVRSAGELFAVAYRALERARESGEGRACAVQNELLDS